MKNSTVNIINMTVLMLTSYAMQVFLQSEGLPIMPCLIMGAALGFVWGRTFPLLLNETPVKEEEKDENERPN
jgi:hypothetical protein